MKKLVIAIFIMAGISAMAQDHSLKGKRSAMNDLSPDQVATLQTKKMTLALDLNAFQQSKMKSMLTADANTRKTKIDAFKAKKEAGETMTADEKFTMQNERLDHEIARKQEMKELLTAEQYAKWEKMKRKKRRGHGGNRNGDKKEMGSKKG